MWFLLALLTSAVGLSLLALSQASHWYRVNKSHTRRPGVRAVGWVLIGASFIVCIARDGVSLAMLIWPMVTATVSVAVALLLAFRPRWLRSLARLLSVG
ncbi:MAG: DUF3325 domain-containing protein [Pseudomonadota bacterium]